MVFTQLLRRYASALVLITICFTAFLAIAILSAQIFEHVPHSEDEVAYIFQANIFAQGRFAVPTPPHRQAFWTPFVLDYQGQRFGKYPPGWPFLLSLGVRLNAPWLVNAILGTVTLALIAWLGYCFYDKNPRGLQDSWGLWQVGLWAAGLGLVTPGFLFLSSSLLSHPASLFWSTLASITLYYSIEKRGASQGEASHWCVVRGAFSSRTTHYAARVQAIYATLTGLSLGATFITRPFAAVGIGLAIGLFLLILIIRREIKWTVLLWLALGGLPITVLSPLYWWVVTGNPAFNAYLLVWPYDRIGFGPDIGPYGYGLYDALFINTHLKLTTLATGLFGWPGWSNLIFLPIPFLARRANRWDWLLLGTLLGLIVVHIFYWAFGGADGGFPRYYYDALPALLLLTIRGIQVSGNILASWQFAPLPQREGIGGGESPAKERFRWPKLTPSLTLPLVGGGENPLYWLPVGLVISFVVYNLIWNLPPLLTAQKGKYGITAAQLQAVEQAHLVEPALVIIKNVDRWSDFAAPFAANSPTLDGPVVYASDESPTITQKLREQFKGRTCWELLGENLRQCP